MNGHATITAIQAGVPTLLWGRPGTGKTSFVKALGTALNLPTETVIASIREPSDFAGLPIVTGNDNVKLAPPAWAVRLKEAGNGILFLDEVSTAPPAVQSALLRVVLERVVGDIEIPQSVWIIAAGNPTDTSTGTWTLSAALANRFVHIEWNVVTGDWIEGMLMGWKSDVSGYLLPANWRERIAETRTQITAFIKARPNLLLNEPEQTDDAGRAWPSPRTWDMTATVLAAAREANLSQDEAAVLVTGCVGPGAGLEFLVWLKELDLPDPESLLKSPGKFEVPERGDQIFAILSAVVVAAKGNLTDKRWLAAWEILAKAADEGYTDIAALPAKMLAKCKKDGLTLPESVAEFVPILTAAGLIK